MTHQTEAQRLAALLRSRNNNQAGFGLGPVCDEAAIELLRLNSVHADLERVSMQLVACGVVAMSDTPDSAKKARAMHPDYESVSCDDVKRRVDECIELRARVAELEVQLESIGAGGVGPLIKSTRREQHLDMVPLPRPQVDLIIQELARYCNTGEVDDAESLLASLQFSLDPSQQPPTTEQSSAVDQPEPAYLLRDLADDIGVKALDLIAAIRAAGLGDYSVNMMLPAKVCVAMCQRFAAAPQPPEHYDQQALDLCLTCGWKTLIPGDCCLICARQKPQVEQEPVAVIGDVWTLNWVGSGPIYQIVKKHGLKIGDKLYTHQQNLRCKSNQARLATLWGYVKADQPQVEQEPVASLADAIRAEPTELIRKWRVLELIKDHTRPQPKPLTVEQIDGIINDLDPIFLDTPTGFEEDFCRAVERAHGIGGEA